MSPSTHSRTPRDASTVALVTGATSGIGRAAARKLAARGATVLVTGRRRAKGEAAVAEVRDAHPEGAGAYYEVDFADLDAVRAFARDVERDYDRLDVLVNNAGTGQGERALTSDGIEVTFAVNYVAPFVLTTDLVERLRESAPARVLNTVTVAQDDRAVDMHDGDLADLDAVARGEDFQLEQAYVDSKLALCLFTYELAARLAGSGVTVGCVNPGLVGTTDVTRNAPWGGTKLSHAIAAFLSRFATVGPIETEESAGEMLVQHALTSTIPDGEGAYFDRWTRTDPGRVVHDETLRDRLWTFTEGLVDRPTSVA